MSTKSLAEKKAIFGAAMKTEECSGSSSGGSSGGSGSGSKRKSKETAAVEKGGNDVFGAIKRSVSNHSDLAAADEEEEEDVKVEKKKKSKKDKK